MSDWFSNRGQMIQVAVAVLGLILAVYVAFSQGFVSAIGILICVAMIAAIAPAIIRQVTKSSASTSLMDIRSPVVDLAGASVRREDSESSCSWEYLNVRIVEGERWKLNRGLLENYEIRALSVGIDDSTSAKVTLEIQCDMGAPIGGKEVEKVGHRTFKLPQGSASETDKTVFAIVYTDALIRVFCVRAAHIKGPLRGHKARAMSGNWMRGHDSEVHASLKKNKGFPGFMLGGELRCAATHAGC